MSSERQPRSTDPELVLVSTLAIYPTWIGAKELEDVHRLTPDGGIVNSLLEKRIIEKGNHRDFLIELLHDALTRKSNDYRDGRLHTIPGEDPQRMEVIDKGYGIYQLRAELKAYTEWESAGKPEELSREHFYESYYRLVRERRNSEVNSE